VPAKPERAASYYHSLFSGLNVTDVTSDAEGSAFTVQSSPTEEDTAEAGKTEEEVAAEAGEAAETTEQAPAQFQKAWHSYFPAAHDFSIGIVVQASADSEEALNIDDQVSDLTSKAFAALTLEGK